MLYMTYMLCMLFAFIADHSQVTFVCHLQHDQRWCSPAQFEPTTHELTPVLRPGCKHVANGHCSHALSLAEMTQTCTDTETTGVVSAAVLHAM